MNALLEINSISSSCADAMVEHTPPSLSGGFSNWVPPSSTQPEDNFSYNI